MCDLDTGAHSVIHGRTGRTKPGPLPSPPPPARPRPRANAVTSFCLVPALTPDVCPLHCLFAALFVTLCVFCWQCRVHEGPRHRAEGLSRVPKDETLPRASGGNTRCASSGHERPCCLASSALTGSAIHTECGVFKRNVSATRFCADRVTERL